MIAKNQSKLLKFALLLFVLGTFGATATEAAETPEETAKSFYGWYLKQIVANKSPGDEKATFQKYVSKRLSRWYFSPAYTEYGADYFIDAQDFDDNWQATTGKATIKGNTATLKVKLALPKPKKDSWSNDLTVKWLKKTANGKLTA